MYGLKSSQDVSFIEGKELTQICLSSNQIVLKFSDDLIISMECDLKFGKKINDLISISCDEAPQTKELAVLLGARVENVENKGDNGLSLFFSNNFILIIMDSNKNYESFEIKYKNKSVVV